jgi:hypothetical protein
MDRLDSKDQGKLKIIYLFLSLEKTIDSRGIEKFKEAGKVFDGFDDAKEEIIKDCNSLIAQSFDNEDRFDVISEGICKIAELCFYSNSSIQKECLWSLVNLAFYDGDYSDTERKLLRTLMRKWGIDKSVLLEMEDTAETLVALDTHRNWIKSTHYSYDYINSIVIELDKNQDEITKNLIQTITFE